MSRRSVGHGWLMSGGGAPEGDTTWARAPPPTLSPMRACTMAPTARSSGAARWPDGSMESRVQGPWWPPPPPAPFSIDRVVTRSSPMADDSRLGLGGGGWYRRPPPPRLLLPRPLSNRRPHHPSAVQERVPQQPVMHPFHEPHHQF